MLHGVIQIVRSSGGGGGGSAENEQSILNLKFFLYKKRTRGEGVLKVDKSERTYYLNDPLSDLISSAKTVEFLAVNVENFVRPKIMSGEIKFCLQIFGQN